MTYKV